MSTPEQAPRDRATNDHTPPTHTRPGKARRLVGARRLAGVGRSVGHGVARVGGATRRGSAASTRKARGYIGSGGADESGLARLVELHFVNLVGDAALTVSLAGTIFAIPTDEARSQVAQFLLLTMAPFALLAPMIGPLLDKFRHGRRWAIGATLATRAFLCWVLAGVVMTGSLWLFPAALGALVASKAYAVTRASAIPRVLPDGLTLVNANSRNALAGVAGMAIGGGVAGALSQIGPDWSLRFAFVVYIAATIMAIKLPAQVDSAVGEQDVDENDVVGADPVLPGKKNVGARVAARLRKMPTPLLAALAGAAGARILTGFLTMFMAFLTRETPVPGYGGAVVLGLVVGAAGTGNALGTLIGNLLSRYQPEAIIACALSVDVVAVALAALRYELWTLLVLGFCSGLCAQLIKLSTDAIIQRDVPEQVRTRTFAWCETTLQSAWVIGGGIGISLPLIPRLGFGVVTVMVAGALILCLRIRRRPPPGAVVVSP